MSTIQDRIFEDSIDEEAEALIDMAAEANAAKLKASAALLLASSTAGTTPSGIASQDISPTGTALLGTASQAVVPTFSQPTSAAPVMPPAIILGLGGPPPVQSASFNMEAFASQMASFMNTMQICLPALMTQSSQAVSQGPSSSSALAPAVLAPDIDKVLPMDSASVEARVMAMPQAIRDGISKIIPGFKADMRKFARANDRVDSWSEKHKAFADEKWPSGYRPFVPSPEAVFQTPWSETADADWQSKLLIPQGTTRARALEMMNMYMHVIGSHIELEAAKENRQTLEVAAKKDLLKSQCIHVGRAYDKELQEVPITALDAPVGD